MGGGGKQTTTTYEKKEPWSGQQPYLLDAFKEAQTIYDKQKKQNDPGYQGDFYAQATPQMRSTFEDALKYSGGAGVKTASGLEATGNRQIKAGEAGLAEAQRGLTDFNTRDWTATHIENAGRYANNPFMDAMIEASMRDAQRTFSEETMRGIDQNAALTGNMNSTRAGIAAGIAQRGLADKAADVSATMRGAAWDKGLGMSQADQQLLLQGLTTKAGVSQSQLETGLGAVKQGTDLRQQLLDQGVLATTMLQGFDQAKIDNAIAKYDYKQNKEWNNLGNYWSIIGDKSWGGTTQGTQTVKNSPSALSSIGTGIAILGSLFRCDARVKHIFKKVGETVEGLPLYLIQYRDAPHMGLHITPLAQDVQKLFPEAVKEIHGILHIDTRVYDWR